MVDVQECFRITKVRYIYFTIYDNDCDYDEVMMMMSMMMSMMMMMMMMMRLMMDDDYLYQVDGVMSSEAILENPALFHNDCHKTQLDLTG